MNPEHHSSVPSANSFSPLTNQSDTSPMSLKAWVVNLPIQIIPRVGFIFLIVWAVDNNTNVNKQNWARAMLIMYAFGLGISIFFFIFLAGFFHTLFG
ncbi:hypothetical protein FBQ87_09465 [Sphingobacteriales bacterium CHB3]|nr:hypothetical protein [Sphingobacteriales bacterium CHB3]